MRIETAPGLVFDCSVGGHASAPLVMMLHGFCVSRYFWDHQIPVLAAAGYFVAAPNWRGYADGVRPDPTDFYNYPNRQTDRRCPGHRYWRLPRWPAVPSGRTRLGRQRRLDHRRPLAGADRVGDHAVAPASCIIRARLEDRSRAAAPVAPPPGIPRSRRRAEATRRKTRSGVRDRLARNGIPDEAIKKHSSVIGNPPAMEAALAWYRARGGRVLIVIWGEADDTMGRIAAECTAEFIHADYRFAPLPGIGHYAANQQPMVVNELLLDRLVRHPV